MIYRLRITAAILSGSTYPLGFFWWATYQGTFFCSWSTHSFQRKVFAVRGTLELLAHLDMLTQHTLCIGLPVDDCGVCWICLRWQYMQWKPHKQCFPQVENKALTKLAFGQLARHRRAGGRVREGGWNFTCHLVACSDIWGHFMAPEK